MYVETLCLRNFRRLKDIQIDLDPEISIFVGPNNSGKTSVGHALRLFTGGRDGFAIHDFSADCWPVIDAYGLGIGGAALPRIALDLWLHVESTDLHRVIDLLPSLDWTDTRVGLRIELAAIDESALLARFRAAQAGTSGQAATTPESTTPRRAGPRTLCEYLAKNLRREFDLRYSVLDPARFTNNQQDPDYEPSRLAPEHDPKPKDVVARLLRVDFLAAQRHLADTRGTRSEDLSRSLGRFYTRHLPQHESDYVALEALEAAEIHLDRHLATVFQPVLARLSELGYPGLANPRLVIKSALEPDTLLSNTGGPHVHYALDGDQGENPSYTLPDAYNGLGFKNLIYMVIELLHVHSQWMATEERPPLHLLFIEEPEAHLHAQLQQVFIRKVLALLAEDGDDPLPYRCQVAVTTHSAHILYERGFLPIRYFRRSPAPGTHSEVLNLSAFYNGTEGTTRDFLQRYLKLTHCDLFFADAAILVEGTGERLLLPSMIEKSAPTLQSAYLSILEVGGAFGHRLRSLIEFLGIAALVVTDIDSVFGPPLPDGAPLSVESSAAAALDQATRTGRACLVQDPGAVTSNQTLVQWLPGKSTIADLLNASEADRIQPPTQECGAAVRVAYQGLVPVQWAGESVDIAGRTLEEAFVLENLPWALCLVGLTDSLNAPGADALSASELAAVVHQHVAAAGFNKTDFALHVLAHPDPWKVPRYIRDGLAWLAQCLMK